MAALHHEVRGEGAPILFLHPGIADSQVWEPQWERYATRFHLVRCDLPGFGETPLAGTRVAPAQDVADLLDELDLGRVTIVGCSYGARVALELAIARPELVRALVLAGALMPGLEPSQALRDFTAAEEEALGRGDIDAAVEINLRTWFDGPHRAPGDVEPEARAAVGRMCRRSFELQLPFLATLEEERLVPDLEERLGTIAQPALVLVGEEDVEDVIHSADLLAAALPSAELATVPGAAHIPNLERPDAFDAAVLPFLELFLG